MRNCVIHWKKLKIEAPNSYSFCPYKLKQTSPTVFQVDFKKNTSWKTHPTRISVSCSSLYNSSLNWTPTLPLMAANLQGLLAETTMKTISMETLAFTPPHMPSARRLSPVSSVRFSAGIAFSRLISLPSSASRPRRLRCAAVVSPSLGKIPIYCSLKEKVLLTRWFRSLLFYAKIWHCHWVFLRKYAVDQSTKFKEASEKSNLVPLYRYIFSDHLTPVLAYRSLVKEDDRDAPSFLFESVEPGLRASSVVSSISNLLICPIYKQSQS